MNRLLFVGRIGIHHRCALLVHDRRERHVLAVQAGLENGAKSGIGTQRLKRVDVADVDLVRAVSDGVAEEFGARVALVQAHVREPRQVHQAEHDDNGANDGGDAEDLLAFDAETHSTDPTSDGRWAHGQAAGFRLRASGFRLRASGFETLTLTRAPGFGRWAHGQALGSGR